MTFMRDRSEVHVAHHLDSVLTFLPRCELVRGQVSEGLPRAPEQRQRTGLLALFNAHEDTLWGSRADRPHQQRSPLVSLEGRRPWRTSWQVHSREPAFT